DEGEAAVGVGGDDHRDRQARLQLLRGGIERLAELHDVQATLAQRRTNRRTGIGLAGLDLQFDVADDFLCHFLAPASASARVAGSSRLVNQAFSTWPNSSSTGVERPKMRTATRR